MRSTPAILTLWGCLSLSMGCGGTDASETEPTLPHALAAVEGEVGTWTPSSAFTGPFAYRYRFPVRLKNTNEVMSIFHNRVARYSPAGDTWRSMNDMCAESVCHAVELAPLSSGAALATVDRINRRGSSYGWSLSVYNPSADTWTDLSPPVFEGTGPLQRDFIVTVLGSGRVLQSGGTAVPVGEYDHWVPFNRAAEYDFSTQSWTNVAPMNVARQGHRAVLLYSDKVLVLGGGSSTAEVYDASKKTWKLTATPPFTGTPRLAFRLNSGQVLIFPEQSAPGATSAYLYDPYNNRWLSGPPLPMENPVNATLLNSGEVLVTNDAGDAQLYDPTRGAWVAAARGAPLSDTRSVLLSSGQVFRQGITPDDSATQGGHFIR